MVSFHMWRRSLLKYPDPRQITWLFGSEKVLVDEVVDYVRERLAPSAWNYASFFAGQDSERTIWTEAEQLPLDGQSRMVVIRDAENLQDLDRFLAWMKARTYNPHTHLVLISNVDRIPKTELTKDERKQGVRPTILPHLAAIGTKGHTIECRPFTSTTAHHSISWVKTKVRVTDPVARYLMERSNFRLRLVRDTCVKLAAFPGTPSIPVINELLAEQPRDSFVSAVFSLDRKGALLALREVPESDYGLLIGQLDSHLELVGMVHDMQSEYKGTGDITRAAGKQAFLVPDLLPIAKHYDTKRRFTIRRLLEAVDVAHRQGVHVGTFEALTALW